MTRLSITVTDHPSCSIIALNGEVDLLSADRLRQALDESISRGRVRLIVDAARLTFCDSAGLRVLLEGNRRAAAAGGHLRLAYVHGVVHRILEVSQLIGTAPHEGEFALMVVVDG